MKRQRQKKHACVRTGVGMNQIYFDRLVKEIERQGLDAMLIAPSPDLGFLIGHVPLFCLRFQGLFVTKEGDYFYVCNLLTADEMREVLPNKKVYSWFDGDGFIETTRQALSEHGLIGKTIGVSSAVRAFNLLEIMEKIDVRFVSARELCAEIRIRKTPEEASHMNRAVQIAVEAMERTIPQIRAGLYEKDVQDILVGHMRALGAEAGSAMVASGPNSGFAHYNSNTRQLQKGDTVLIDYACVYRGMLSDITRTFFLEEHGERQKEVYELVKKSILAAEQALADGERWIPAIDRAARRVIEEGGYGTYFTTRLGHGLGYMPHESPDIKQNNERYLEPGMAFTIEPGIYMPDEFGVRIEDCLIMTPEGGFSILSGGLSKDCRVIGRAEA